jgi:hypothetical protein
MLAHLAIHTPKPARIDDLITSMQRFAAAGRSQAGLQEVHTMRDTESGKLLGLAIWERGLRSGRPSDADGRRERPVPGVGGHHP